MATSKTLTPTNVTISIPEFTDQPDQRVNSNCIDKEADAINTLNSNFTGVAVPNGDCNNATATGRYLASLTTSNTPGSSHWVIDVIRYNANEISQTAHGVYGSSQVFERALLNGTWSAWKQLVTKNAQTFSVAIASNGVFDLGFTGHTIIGITLTEPAYYTVKLYQGSSKNWAGVLESAANGTRPSSGTCSGTLYYID